MTAATLTGWREGVSARWQVGIEDPSHRCDRRGAKDAEVSRGQPGDGQRATAGTDSADGAGKAFLGFRPGAAEGLRHDHASQFTSDDFQNEITFLGIESSPAFVGEPEGNGCIERFFRTLKEQLLWVRHFQSIPELVRALEEFRALYNHHWLIERLGFEPPVQARQRVALKPAHEYSASYRSKKSGAVHGRPKVKPASGGSNTCKGHCPQCDQNLNASIVASESRTEQWEADGLGRIEVVNTYRILQCRGCETLYVQRAYWISESQDPPRVTHWPSPPAPDWVRNLPTGRSEICCARFMAL